MAETKYKYPTTSTTKMHQFIDEFGEGMDKVIMMRRLAQFRKYVQKEVGREFKKALDTVDDKLDTMY